MKQILLGWAVLLAFSPFAQNPKVNVDEAQKIGEAKKSEIFQAEFVGERHPVSADLEWVPTLNAKVDRIKHPTAGDLMVDSIKAAKLSTKLAMAGIMGEGEGDMQELGGYAPVVAEDFNGNFNSGSSPLDNSMAISNDGTIITVANTTIMYKTEAGGTTFNSSLLDFVGDPAIDYICDPVVLYDAEEDRFIFFAQECTGSSLNSRLLIMFSLTNDPNDGWNYYKLTGNPNSDGSWFDYPKVGISSEDLFITGNLFTDGGSFNESVIYQMDKDDGYDGISLTWQYWNDIPGFPFTILPVSSGNEFNYGPGIYCVASTPFSGNTIKFYDITDDIDGSPSLNYYSISTPYYEVAADSPQQGTSCLLDIGDCRALSGFYLNGTIHFVFQSDAGSTWNGINYNRLDVEELSNESDVFGNPGTMDYSYPAVSWFGFGPSDKSVLIGFGSVSSSDYPQIRAVQCNDAGEWSETTMVYEGDSYASYTSPTKERWGDYSGSARKHDAAEPTVWISGAYANGSNRWQTRIAEITGEYVASVVETPETTEMTIAPNPVIDAFTLYFDLEAMTDLDIQIIDMNGKLVKALYSGEGKAGHNQFTFNKAKLSRGIYFLQVKSSNSIIANEKIIVQ